MKKITPQSIIRKGKDIPCKDLKDEGMILNLQTGDYFNLSEVGFFIWKSLDGKNNLNKISSRLVKRYGISKSRALSDVMGFTKSLQRNGLISLLE